mmetsp:Transcript_39330/g.77002  ORF Transcript_39330/g.77002 Transcript_39330/m.77002 type:complete len:453 (+) Transcript_39330:47-1405(+)|eukprot:CAMPEP_0173379334 /NCGR_PEP_ID=MMETSP1356-20130122/2325_1 /TAXON_ID=77927 ORGANISM="Hemiselmis virescens, Strain PCC157" /NCGR_SAMPLE_ID=MMETSP1356 /ASSEMBLY_ACC=CAM_ASM_000847 /LENGTH=452 /DNA_ID=CAMNT_0014332655 /DNA_START=41 /DNA_END=1399 /DNA_ORIENTATION=-
MYSLGAAAAALALNLTASVLSVYFGESAVVQGDQWGHSQACTALMQKNHSVYNALDADRKKLIFGDLEGLLPQPDSPGGSIVIFGARGGDDKGKHGEHRGDTIPMCNSIIEMGWSCLPLFYSDEAFEDLHRIASTSDGYISRVNPDVYEGVTLEKYEALLEQLGDMGLAAMPHPRFMQLFGSKEALARISNLRTGMADTVMYQDEATFRVTFSNNLAQGARVLKQNRGSQGEGIWICKLEDESLYGTREPLSLDSGVLVTEALDNSVQRKTLGQLLDHGAQYLDQGDVGGGLVDQAFMPRIIEGEVRVMFVGDTPVEIVHKKPKEGGVSATLKSGATYTRYSPDDALFARLMKSFQRDIPLLLPSLGLQDHPLPLLWTADFILGPARHPWSDADGDHFFIGELNCSCVGITTQLHLTKKVAAEAIKICQAHREMRDNGSMVRSNQTGAAAAA